MPSNTLAIPAGPAVPVWDFALAQLQQDDALKRLRPDWQIPTSASWQAEPAANRVTIRLTPKLTRGQPVALAGTANGRLIRELTLTIEVDAATQTNFWADAAALASAIEAAIMGSNLTDQARASYEQQWQALGVMDRFTTLFPDWSQPGSLTFTIWSEV